MTSAPLAFRRSTKASDWHPCRGRGRPGCGRLASNMPSRSACGSVEACADSLVAARRLLAALVFPRPPGRTGGCRVALRAPGRTVNADNNNTIKGVTYTVFMIDPLSNGLAEFQRKPRPATRLAAAHAAKALSARTASINPAGSGTTTVIARAGESAGEQDLIGIALAGGTAPAGQGAGRRRGRSGRPGLRPIRLPKMAPDPAHRRIAGACDRQEIKAVRWRP